MQTREIAGVRLSGKPFRAPMGPYRPPNGYEDELEKIERALARVRRRIDDHRGVLLRTEHGKLFGTRRTDQRSPSVK